VVRPHTYRSEAKGVLEPTLRTSGQIATAIGTLQDADTLGTYVEFLSVRAPGESRRFPGVQIKVRALVDPGGGSGGKTRIIKLFASSHTRSSVRLALKSRIASATKRQRQLKDLWHFRVIEAPTRPESAPPTTKSLLSATILLSMLGALIATALIGGTEAEPAGGSRLRSRVTNLWRRAPRPG
jgi:hypothetical protein